MRLFLLLRSSETSRQDGNPQRLLLKEKNESRQDIVAKDHKDIQNYLIGVHCISDHNRLQGMKSRE